MDDVQVEFHCELLEDETCTMTIKIFTTGGTIDKTYFDDKSEYQVGEPQAHGVLQRANVVVDYSVESLMQKDSLHLTDSDRLKMREAVEGEDATQIVITHGTDTMVETGAALKSIPNKTIVLTGSMYPAQYRDSDAVFNLGCALIAAQTLPPGVYIAMNGRVFDPLQTRKNVDKNRFEEAG